MSREKKSLSNPHLRQNGLLRPALSLFLALLVCATPVAAQPVDRAKLLEEIIALQNQIKNTTDPAQLAALRDQLNSKETLFLAPAPEDTSTFADWLKQPGAGLIRLLPREKFDGVLSIRGGGAYYSFVSQVHFYGFGSDLSLERETLSVGFAGADFGFLAPLGTTPLESIGFETPGVSSLASFTPPLDEPGARQQQRRASEGFQENGFSYRNRFPVSAGGSFALRSVGYSGADVLVAFRVYRQDADGSLIIPWKLLRRYATPQLSGDTVVTTSAASYAQSNYSREAIAVAFGKDLAGGDFYAMSSPLPTQLGGVRVSVQDSSNRGFQLTASLFAVTPTQANFLVPSEAVDGYALITVNTASGKSLQELVRIAKTAPGLFTANADGKGVPAAVALRVRNGVQT